MGDSSLLLDSAHLGLVGLSLIGFDHAIICGRGQIYKVHFLTQLSFFELCGFILRSLHKFYTLGILIMKLLVFTNTTL